MNQKLELIIPYYNASLQGLIWDCKTYCNKYNYNFKCSLSRKFEEEIEFRGSLGLILFWDKRILIDLQDNPREYEFYKNFDFVFKRSYSKYIQYSEYVFPFGLRVDIFDGLWYVFFTNIRLFIFDKRNRRELIRTLFNLFNLDYQGMNNLKRNYKKLKSYKVQELISQRKILYSTRLWLQNSNGFKISHERKSISEALAKRKDVILNTISQISQSEYFSFSLKSNILVINNGLHDVPGLRLAEAIIMGKLIISTDLNIVVPGLIENEHYLLTNIDDLNNLLDNINIEKISKFQKSCSKFTSMYFDPGCRLEYIFSILKKNNEFH